jgi:hypothetical protein
MKSAPGLVSGIFDWTQDEATMMRYVSIPTAIALDFDDCQAVIDSHWHAQI